nr:type II toxin-antitoxin system VapC family toxin [Methylomicrobium sp. RS1]
MESLFEHLGFVIQPIPKETLFLAGKAFLQYKKRHGGKSNGLPDFFIGAHTAVANYRLITRNRGRFSTSLPSVELIMPNRLTH